MPERDKIPVTTPTTPSAQAAAAPDALVGTPAVGPKVEPVSGELLVMRVPTPEDADAVETTAAVELATSTGSTVIVLVGDTRLEALPDDVMAQYGWVRATPETKRTSEADLIRVVKPKGA